MLAHLPQAGLPLPAQVSGLFMQSFHLLGMRPSSLLQLGPKVPQLRHQGVHSALGQMCSSDVVLK